MLSAKVTIVKYAQFESAINFPDVRHDTTPASWEVMSPFVSLDTVCLGQKGGHFSACVIAEKIKIPPRLFLKQCNCRIDM